jgi:hypothetical protein
MKYANGDVYEGNFKEGKMEGNGKMRFGNGKRYDGEWKNNKRDGIGSTYNEYNVLVNKGIWKNDKYFKKK